MHNDCTISHSFGLIKRFIGHNRRVKIAISARLNDRWETDRDAITRSMQKTIRKETNNHANDSNRNLMEWPPNDFPRFLFSFPSSFFVFFLNFSSFQFLFLWRFSFSEFAILGIFLKKNPSEENVLKHFTISISSQRKINCTKTNH